MRGKRKRSCRYRFRLRIIPARAGQTWPCTRARTSRPDHPRACGANSPGTQLSTVVAGSSPRVRGKRLGCRAGGCHRRIIPARAGQTIPSKLFLISVVGSSPRVRGKLHGEFELEGRRRIIPARAGQTPTGLEDCHEPADHPRACGANLGVFGIVHTHPGSSPRVRGKPVIQRVHVDFPRIIPARAGQTGRTSSP